MKKILAIATMAALAAGAFAEGITFGSWGRGLFVVSNGYDEAEDENIVTGDINQSWGGNAPRTALAIHGDSENVGFALDIHSNGYSLGQGDNAYIYVKPLPIVTAYLGKLDVNVLRSDAAYGLWAWDRLGYVGSFGEGAIFPDLLDRNLSVVATPVEGLTIGAAVNTGLDGTQTNIKNLFGNNSAAALGYTIPGVGTVKLGIHGNNNGVNEELDEEIAYTTINAAFEYTGVENLYAAIGIQTPSAKKVYGWTKTAATEDSYEWAALATPDYGDESTAGAGYWKKTAATDAGWKYTDDDGNPIAAQTPTINLYARYKADAATIHFSGTIKLFCDDIEEGDIGEDGNALGFYVGAGVDYDLGEGLGVFADIRYANGIWTQSSSADNTDNLVLGFGVQKGFSNGVLGVAFEGSTNSNGRNKYDGDDVFAWEIPVKFEYWF